MSKENESNQPEIGNAAANRVDHIVSGQWYSMENAPKNGDEILLFASGDIGVCYWRDDNIMTGWTWGLEKAFNNPSHWMPLPVHPAR